jgi:hypothetical protein
LAVDQPANQIVANESSKNASKTFLNKALLNSRGKFLISMATGNLCFNCFPAVGATASPAMCIACSILIFTFCHYPNVLLIRMLHAIHIAGLAVAPTAGKQLKHRLPVAIDIRNLPREFSNALFKKVFEAFLLLSLATI